MSGPHAGYFSASLDRADGAIAGAIDGLRADGDDNSAAEANAFEPVRALTRRVSIYSDG